MSPLLRSYKCIRLNLTIFYRNFSDTKNRKPDEQSNDKLKKSDETKKTALPEPPTTCCMSGCANCVWLDYAEKLSEYYKDGGEKAIKEINENITDENIKAFILHELRMRKK